MATQGIAVSNKSNAVVSPSQMGTQTVVGANLSELIEEVSVIEAKLSQAIAMIASTESGAVSQSKTETLDEPVSCHHSP